MKKVSLILLSIATVGSMMFVGCKKDTQTVTLGVKLESAAADGKLYIDDYRNPVFLDNGEQINVNGQTYSVVKNGSNYNVTVNGGNPFYAAYPATLPVSESGFSGTTDQLVHLSRWQKYECDANGVQNVKLPAAAVITDNSNQLLFYNLCSLLEIQWTNASDAAYDIIGIEVTVPDQALYGDGRATLNGTSSKITMTAPITNNRVNLDIANNYRETVAAGTASRKYYVVLPTFEGKNVTVRIQTLKTNPATADDQKLKTVTVSTSAPVTLPRNTIVPMHISATPKEDNSLTGYFSISDDLKVVFSRGNLQHVGSTSPSSGTWKFADRQYDFFGGKNITSTGYDPTETMDLFGWSETDFDHYGIHLYDDFEDFDSWGSGSFQDWGTKSISGDAPQTWFTLTADEWNYLLIQRVGGNGQNLCGKAKITGIIGHQSTATNIPSSSTTTPDEVEGFVLLPDDWTSADVPEGLTFNPISSGSATTYNVSQWARMEAAGAIFLPAAGWGSNYHNSEESHTDGGDIYNTYHEGQYWTATRKETLGQQWQNTYAESCYFAFNYDDANWNIVIPSGSSIGNGNYQNGNDMQWWRMRSVRLVKPAPGYSSDSR